MNLRRLSLLFVLIGGFNLVSMADVLHVGHNQEITTIAHGLQQALEGDTVLVHKGVYKENDLVIDKEVYLLGKDGPVIDGQHKGYIITAGGNGFVIDGFVFKNVKHSYTKDYTAILVFKGRNFTISNNQLENVFFGITLEKSKYGLVRNNRVSSNAKIETNSGNGIHLWHCDHMRIERNEVHDLRDGIYFEFVTNSKVSDNRSYDNVRYGLHFMFSNNDVYHNNEFRNNGAGVAVMFSKFIHMHHNTFHYNWGTNAYGLLLKEIYDAEIDHNVFEENTVGINVDGCSRINYHNNKFIKNGWALKFTGGCYANTFEYNNFLSNSFNLSYNSRLNDNKFEANYWSDYTGYDLDKDGIGDVPYRPVNLFSYVVNTTPEALILMRSPFVDLINFSEKVSPIFTPENLIDEKPIMRQINDTY